MDVIWRARIAEWARDPATRRKLVRAFGEQRVKDAEERPPTAEEISAAAERLAEKEQEHVERVRAMIEEDDDASYWQALVEEDIRRLGDSPGEE